MRSLALAGSESLLPVSATLGPGDLLIEALAEAVARKLERIVASQQRLLEVEDAAKYLGMTAHALRHKAGTEVPVVKIDHKLRFDRRDLDRYIDRAKREGI
jgi:Helix-turn-helix domain